MDANAAVFSSKFQINQQVKTPLGVGLYQAPFAVVDGEGQLVVMGVMVRLPVDETTSKALRKSNCLTPGAKVNGLWVFSAEDVKA